MRGPSGYHKLGRRDLALGGAATLVGAGCRESSSPTTTPFATLRAAGPSHAEACRAAFTALRELELAHLFATLRARSVHNVVWLTADVHYAAVHRFDPSRAAFKDLDPFCEFVAGPMHASSFPRERFDDTFGPELAFASAGWNS